MGRSYVTLRCGILVAIGAMVILVRPQAVWADVCLPQSKYPLVVDSGSGYIKVGLTSDQEPQLVRNIAGQHVIGANANGEFYFGEEVLNPRLYLRISKPTQNGIVQELYWDVQKQIWRYAIIERLKTHPYSQLMVMAGPASPPTGYMDKLESSLLCISVLRIVLENEAVLIMRAMGKATGLVVQSGDTVTTAVAVVDGTVLEETYQTARLGGVDITNFLNMQLMGRAFPMGTHETYEENKIKYGYVAFDYEEEMKKDPASLTVSFMKDDVKMADVDRLRFQAPEMMFQPEMFGTTGAVQKVAEASWRKAPVSFQDELLQNVVLAGGNTLFRGFPERFKKEFGQLVGRDVTLHAPEDRQFSIWKGGRIVANEQQDVDR